MLAYCARFKIKLASVTGEPLKVLGNSHIKFKFGNKHLSFDFVVVKKLGKSLILGSDFLTNCDVRWDFQQRTVAIGGTIVTLKDKRNEPSINLVHPFEMCFVPPLTSTVVPCTLSGRAKGDFLLSPLDNCSFFVDQPGLLATSTLVTTNNKQAIGLLVKNDTNKLFSIRKNQIIATAEPFVNTERVETIATSQPLCETNPESLPDSPSTHVNTEGKVSAVQMLTILILTSILTDHIPSSHRKSFEAL